MVTKTSGPTGVMDPFIVITAPSGIKPTGESRRLIRRHVMKGKNTKASKNPMQVILPVVARAPESLDSNAPQQECHVAARSGRQSRSLLDVPRLNATVTTMDLATMGFPTQLEPYMVELISRFYTVVEETGSPLGRCTEKGTSNNPYDLIYNDLAHLHIVLYMAQSYFDARRLAARTTKTMPLFTYSPPHNSLAQNQNYDSVETPQEPSPLALKHMNQAIHHLRRKLEQPGDATSLSAIFVVLALGTCAEAIGNLDAAERHMLGLSQIIVSRGGIASLGGYMLVALKCCRFDISLSLKTGQPPLLMPNPSWKSHLAVDSTHKYPHHASTNDSHNRTHHPTPLHRTCPIPDARLTNIWTDLVGISRSFNLAIQLGRQPDGVLVTEVLVGVMYRLLSLDYSPRTQSSPSHSRTSRGSSPACDGTFPLTPDSIDQDTTITKAAAARNEAETESRKYWDRQHELFRLAMLSFSSTIFFDGHGLETEYPALARDLRHALRVELRSASTPTCAQGRAGDIDVEQVKYHLYLVFIARVSILDTEEDRMWMCAEQMRLRKVLGATRTGSWARVKMLLKEVLWVDVMSDAGGREFYDDASAMGAGKGWVGQGVFGV